MLKGRVLKGQVLKGPIPSTKGLREIVVPYICDDRH